MLNGPEERQSWAPSRFVRQALRIASTRTRALCANSSDFAICRSSLNDPSRVNLASAMSALGTFRQGGSLLTSRNERPIRSKRGNVVSIRGSVPRTLSQCCQFSIQFLTVTSSRSFGVRISPFAISSGNQALADTREFRRAAGISYRIALTLLARTSSDQRWLHGARKEGWLA
jgi:hypothetical protein